ISFMDEQLIFYIDFLGFTEAIRSWDEEKMVTLIGLMSDLASLRCEFDFIEEPENEGFKIRPEVSTFSDHIVISYPTKHLLKLNEEDSLSIGLILVRKLVAQIAAAAMRLGFLIRGGATVGPLYHSGGVVLGKALVESYELESRVSIYPRIAVSRKLYSQVKINPRSLVLLEDHDGITHFNYFPSMILSAEPRERTTWLANARRTVAENIENFEREECWNKLAKWVWFGNSFEQARLGLHDDLFQ
ncbi:MAG TPA: hypothetical protein VMS31_22640, partial [Pyrinomonadaceae bacterium]|nr:hypothetical protein [Pyrinomonadaceae bacterium]